MGWLLAFLALVPSFLAAQDGRAAELARRLRATSLDVEECYRVRDLSLIREDLRLFLTDGHLIFGKPVDGVRYAAVFVADTENADGEMLVFAPTRGERLALAKYTGSPTLNEHFRVAVMIFTDDTYETLWGQIRERGEPRKAPERAILLSEEWNQVFRNLASSFEIRLVQDLLGPRNPSTGVFYAALSGKTLGNFDVVYDPQSREQIVIGKVAFRSERAFFDVWTSFQSRSFRNATRKPQPPDFRVSNFRLDATLEPDLSLKVLTRVTVTPAVKLSTLDFDLSRHMRVTKALIDGAPAEVFQRESMRSNLIQGKIGDDVFLLVPTAKLEPGRSYEVEFHHEGAVVLEAGNRVYYVGSRGNWYPNLPTQFALYDATFRYPQDLDLVAAGDVVEDRTEGGVEITRRKTSSAVRFFGFNLGDYERLSVERAGYTVEVCANRQVEPALQPVPKQVVIAPPGGWRVPRRGEHIVTMQVEQAPPRPPARLRQLADEIAEAFEFMAEHFGPPSLPRLTVSPIPGTFGQGFPGLVYLSTLSYLSPDERPKMIRSEYQRVFFSEILHAHETAHQWWGNIVTAAGYQDEWLMEALANYSALLYLEKRKGREAMASVMEEYKRRLLLPAADGKTTESAGPIIWGVRLESSQTPGAWRTITYEKGSWIMHMLRRRMGDGKFLAMLGELRRRYEYQAVNTEQFRELAREFLPTGSVDPELESFFENWVYSTGIPTLEFKSSVKGKPPAVTVSGTLTQSETSEEFSAYVPVVIQLPGGKSVTKWLETGERPVAFQMTLRQAPLRVVLDPENSVLAERK